MKNTGQPDPTHNSIDANPFLTHLKWPILTCDPFDSQPNWPDQTDPNPTWLARFAMFKYDLRPKVS